MAPVERVTVNLPADMAAFIRKAVSGGDYASSSEVIRDALRDWQIKADLRRRKLEMLRSDIDDGLQDIEAGRLVEPDIDDILARGRRLSAERSRSA